MDYFGGPKFQTLEIHMGHGKLLFFESKATHRRKNFENRTSFRYVSLRTKFYYITQLCEMELPRQFDCFPFFHSKNIFFLWNPNST